MKTASQLPPVLNTWSVRMVESALQRYTLKDALWHYEHGLQVLAIQKVGEVTGEARYKQFVLDWLDLFVRPDGSIRTYRADEYNLDQLNAGGLLFNAFDLTRDEQYRKALGLLREQLRIQPRTHSKGFWHKKIYPYQMWLDGIYMGQPFLAEYARRFNEPTTFEDIFHQICLTEQVIILKHLRLPCLFIHLQRVCERGTLRRIIFYLLDVDIMAYCRT